MNYSIFFQQHTRERVILQNWESGCVGENKARERREGVGEGRQMQNVFCAFHIHCSRRAAAKQQTFINMQKERNVCGVLNERKKSHLL